MFVIFSRGGIGGCNRDGENRVAAKVGFVARAVELDHSAVDRFLILHLQPDQRRGDAGIDILDRLHHAHAAPEIWVAVAQNIRLVCADGGASGCTCSAKESCFGKDICFYHGSTVAVKNLPRNYLFNFRHCFYILSELSV